MFVVEIVLIVILKLEVTPCKKKNSRLLRSLKNYVAESFSMAKLMARIIN